MKKNKKFHTFGKIARIIVEIFEDIIDDFYIYERSIDMEISYEIFEILKPIRNNLFLRIENSPYLKEKIITIYFKIYIASL